MKRLFGFLVLMVLIVGAVGFYRGWWSVQSSNDGSTTGISLTVDKNRIHDDKDKAADKAQAVEHKLQDKVSR